MSGTATLLIAPIGTQAANTPFAVSGSYALDSGAWNQQLEYEDGASGPLSPIPAGATATTTTTFTFTHPGLPVGSHTVSVKDPLTGTVVVSNTFSVVGAKALAVTQPSGVYAGKSWTLQGTLTNYSVPPRLFYRLNGGAQVLIGGVSATKFAATVPALTVGDYTVTVSDGTVTSPVVSFTVTAATVTITPSAIADTPAGQAFTFAGTLAGYTTVPTLTYTLDGGTSHAVTGVTISGWSMQLVAPSTVTSHTIVVTDGTTPATISFNVTAAAKTISPFSPTGVVAGSSFTFKGSLGGYTTIPTLTYAIDGAAAVALTGVSTTGWSMTIAAPAAGSHTVVVHDATNSVTGTATFSTSALAASLRNYYDVPGADDGFYTGTFYQSTAWRTSGSDVTLMRNGTGTANVPTGIVHVVPDYSPPQYIGRASDPVVKVTDGTDTIYVHIPLGAVVEAPTPGDNNIGGIDATRPYLYWSIYGATINTTSVQASGSIITGTLMCVEDASGALWEDAVTGQTGLNNTLGTINDYDLTRLNADPNYIIEHTLQMAFDPAMVSRVGPIWPLLTIDASFPNNGTLPQGLTIGIPYSTARPSGKTRGWYALFDVFKARGAFYYNVAASGCTSFICFQQLSANAALATDLQNSISDVMSYMCIVEYDTTITGSQHSKATQKGFVAGTTLAAPAARLLDLSPTGGKNVAPSTFGAWYPSNYDVTPSNTGGGGSTPTPPPTSTAVTFSATDKSSTITLSADQYTATAGGSTTPYSTLQGVRGTSTIDTTKIVAMEFKITGLTQNFAVGVADATFSFNTQSIGADTHAIAAFPSTGTSSQPAQTVFFNNVQISTGNGVSDTVGDQISVIINGTNFYFSTPAMRSTAGVTWNNSTTADPATNVGGISFAGIGTPFYPIFAEAESGGAVVLNDGTSAFGSFLASYLTANPSVVTLSGQVTTSGTPTITINQPAGVTAGASFTFSGTLSGYATAPNLTYSIDGLAASALAGVTASGWTTTLSIATAGSHTIEVTDGSHPATVTFNVTSTSSGRVPAPLSGAVSTGTWVQNQSITVPAMPNGFMRYDYLLPAQYSSAYVYPILIYGHENDEGMNGNSYPNVSLSTASGSIGINTSTGKALSADSVFNTVAFRTGFPCIVIVPYCDQSLDSQGGSPNSNFGGYADTPNSGGNEQAIIALVNQFIASFSVDTARIYATGDSLGAIGTIAWLVDNNAYGTGTSNHLFAAGMGFSDQLYRPNVNGGSNAGAFSAMQNVPYLAIGTPNDNNVYIYDQAAWQFYTGNSNYPTPAQYSSGGVAALRAGSTSFYFLNTTLDVPWNTGYRQLNADGGIGTPLYQWLFSQVGPTGSAAKINLTGVAISSATGVASSAVGTNIGTLTAQGSGGALTNVAFAISSQTGGTNFSLSGSTLQFASASVAAGSYTVNIQVTAGNAVNSPQVYPLTITITAAGSLNATSLKAWFSSIKGASVVSGQFIEMGTMLGGVQACVTATGKQPGFLLGDMWYYDGAGAAGYGANQYLLQQWNQKGLVGYIFSMPSPAGGGGSASGNAPNPTDLVTAGTAVNTQFNVIIDQIATGLRNLTNSGVGAICIRPFHENNGNWFWWGTQNFTSAQFIAMWQYFIDRLVNTNGLTNLVVVYSVNAGITTGFPDNRYPGDAYVDVVGWDLYDSNPGADTPDYDFLQSTYPSKILWLSEFGPGSASAGDPSFDLQTLITALAGPLVNSVLWTEWGLNGGGAGWGFDEVSNVAALNDPRVLNAGQISFFP